MNQRIHRDSRGMALVAIVIVVVVVAALGGIGYSVMKKNDDKKTANSTTTAASKAVQDACNKLYDDKDLCKFSSSYSGKGPYVGTFTSTDKDGHSSTFTTSMDASGNSSTIITDGGKESSALISLNGDSYIKDETDGSWTKYPKSTDATTTADTNPTNDLKIITDDSTVTEDKRTTYKKLGTEACDTLTCFKYQVIDPAQPGTESIIWFGTKDYQLHKWSFKDADGSTNVGTFVYTAVTIKAPTPVKEAPSVPTQAEIDKMIQDATQGSGDSGN